MLCSYREFSAVAVAVSAFELGHDSQSKRTNETTDRDPASPVGAGAERERKRHDAGSDEE